MKRIKKLLCLCLSCAMLTALTPAVIFAEAETPEQIVSDTDSEPESSESAVNDGETSTEMPEVPETEEVTSISLNELLQNAELITPPCQFEYDLEDGILYADGEDSDSGYAIKVDLQENTIFSFNYFGKNAEDDIDTYFDIYKEIDGTFQHFKSVDENNYDSSDGEKFTHLVSETGTYYILLRSYDDAGTCIIEADIRPNDRNYRNLDFTSEILPEPAEGDLWNWDNETRTLTLYDGFQAISLDTPAITLPEESVIYIEGTADIKSNTNDCIDSKGNITIIGHSPTESELTLTAADDEAFYAEGDITITDSTLNITTGYYGIRAGENVTITNATLDINSKSTAVSADDVLRVEDSTISIVSHSTGLHGYQNVTVNNSNIKIDTTDGSKGISSSDGDIAITGGTLDVMSPYSTLDVWEYQYISLTDVEFNLQTTQAEYPLISTHYSTDFSLPGTFTLYDINGNQLYTGTWSPDLLEDHTLAVNGTPVHRAVSGHYLTKVEAKKPTATENGNKEYYICSKCGKMFEDEAGTIEITDSDSVIVPATGDSPVTPSEPSNPDKPVSTNTNTNANASKTPKTGDTANVFLWFTLLLASICGIIGVAIYNKRKTR